MTYEEALGFIHGIERFGRKPGLRRIKMLLELMGNPQDTLRYIHVAGTNGKGSTSTMLSCILTHAGYKTGLYISPFVLDFRERIQINNEMIPENKLIELTQYVKSFWDELNAKAETPTEFEFVVALTLEYFAREKCDIVVLEVGMGGRLDSTNVIASPLVSVITSISLDHMRYLGNTIKEIAYEKCGVIKRGGVTVCYPRQDPEALEVIMERCAEEENKLFMPSNAEILHMDADGSDIDYGGLKIRIPLAGEHQIYNAMAALEAIRALELSSMEITDEDIIKGIAAVNFPARFEKFGGKPLIIIDGAHNPEKMRALGESLKLLGGRAIHAIVGLTGEKDLDLCLGAVLPHCKSVCVTTVQGFPKGIPATLLWETAVKYCTEVHIKELPNEAFDDALSRCDDDEILLVCGSLYMASALRPIAIQKAAKQAATDF